MSGARQLRPLAIGVNADIEERRHLRPVLPLHERMEPLQDLVRGSAVVGIGLERRPKLAHHGCRPDAAADDVTHGEDDAPIA